MTNGAINHGSKHVAKGIVRQGGKRAVKSASTAIANKGSQQAATNVIQTSLKEVGANGVNVQIQQMTVTVATSQGGVVSQSTAGAASTAISGLTEKPLVATISQSTAANAIDDIASKTIQATTQTVVNVADDVTKVATNNAANATAAAGAKQSAAKWGAGIGFVINCSMDTYDYYTGNISGRKWSGRQLGNAAKAGIAFTVGCLVPGGWMGFGLALIADVAAGTVINSAVDLAVPE